MLGVNIPTNMLLLASPNQTGSRPKKLNQVSFAKPKTPLLSAQFQLPSFFRDDLSKPNQYTQTKSLTISECKKSIKWVDKIYILQFYFI